MMVLQLSLEESRVLDGELDVAFVTDSAVCFPDSS
jgi:hypothetical protein